MSSLKKINAINQLHGPKCQYKYYERENENRQELKLPYKTRNGSTVSEG